MVVQTTFRHVRATRTLEDLIQAKAKELGPLDSILECRVLMDRPHRRHRQGNAIHVRIELSRPGEDVVVNIDEDRGVQAAIDSAFEVARRRLEDVVGRRRANTRHGRVPS